MLRRIHAPDRGASFVEYAAVVAFVGIILFTLLASGLATKITDGFQSAISEIFNDHDIEDQVEYQDDKGSDFVDVDSLVEESNEPGKDSEESGATGPEGIPQLIPGDESDAGFYQADLNDPAYWHPGGDSNGVVVFGDNYSREETREDSDDPEAMPEGENYGIDGDSEGGSGLGEPVEGETAKEPNMPGWEPRDLSAGDWNSEPKDGIFRKRLVEAAARSASIIYPDAARNLLYYLTNSGEPLRQDVDSMLEEMHGFEDYADAAEMGFIEDAVEEARSSGSTGPVTFPLSTDWMEYKHENQPSRDSNWFNAVGDFEWGISGTITVYPPSNPGEGWGYSSETRIHMRDHYNWDDGKATKFGPIWIKDKDMRDLHRQGVAREFSMFGDSDYRINEGEF